MIGKGYEQGFMPDQEALSIMGQYLNQLDLNGKKLLLLIPDTTRTAPMPLIYQGIYDLVGEKVARLDVLVALGTHPAMSEEKILEWVGITPEEHRRKYPKTRFFNHAWDDPKALTVCGTIGAAEMATITGGLMSEDVPVTVNKLIYDYDRILITGPVVPHEVVGFSGGNKYIFPGIAGQEIIDFFHWLGALITIPKIIGVKDTPVRRVLNRSAQFLTVPRSAFCFVINDHKLVGFYAGTPEEAWDGASTLSDKLHIVYKDQRYQSILGLAPPKFDDLWTGGKVSYKLQNIVEDGGDLIIYAPSIDEVSYTHGRLIDQIGYHCRDFYYRRMEEFSHIPRGILAHSTHVKGAGTYENGVEKPRINVILATSIPEERCRKINLGYLDYRTIDPQQWANREDEGYLLVPEAGDLLFRYSGDKE
jgi:nickel-dependent lactate racemase